MSGKELTAGYVELRAHSWYSFGAGASAVSELVSQVAHFGYTALGLTDAGNMCGGLDFAQQCRAAGIQAILGVDLQVREGDSLTGPVTLLAETGLGYANICRLVSLIFGGAQGGSRFWRE